MSGARGHSPARSGHGGPWTWRHTALCGLAFITWAAAIGAVVFWGKTDQALDNYVAAMDFRAMYTGARMALGGVREGFYSLEEQFAWQQREFPELTHFSRLMPFPYPPFVAALLAPLGYLSPPGAFAVWAGANLLLVGASLCLALASLPRGNPPARVAALALTLGFAPVWVVVFQGQLTGLKLLALWGAWHLLRRGREVPAGAALALLAVKPQFLLLPGAYLLLTRRWRALAGLALAGAVLVGVSYAMVGPAGLAGYARLLAAAPDLGDALTVHPQKMFSLRGLLHRLAGSDALGDVLVPWLAGLAAVGAALAWAWQPARRGERGDLLDLDWALLAVAMVVTSPQANLHSLALLTVAGVLATRHALAHEAADGALRLLPWAFGAGAALATALTVAAPQAMVPVWLAVEGAWLGLLLWAAGRRSEAVASPPA